MKNKTMLQTITLDTIQKIFDESEESITTMSKMVYVNCLMHHFKDKKATIANSVYFEIFDTDFDYERFKKNIHELHKAGLVTINGSVIRFDNMWGRHIDKTQLENKIDESQKGGFFDNKDASNFENTLRESTSTIELCGMRYRLKEEQVRDLITVFIKEQNAVKKKYNKEEECLRHFLNWVGKNQSKAPQPNQVVKSKGKLIGK